MKFTSSTITGALVAGAVAFGGAGCTDLEEQPFSSIEASDFGQTEDQFIAVLGAAYTSLYGLPGGHGNYWSIVEIASDEAIIPQRGADWFDGGIWLRQHSHTWNESEPGFNGAWVQLFAGVSTCNRLIETLQALNPDAAGPFVNELRGLRALYYYWLIDNFGNVPIVEGFADADPSPTSNTRADVYEFLVSELEEIGPTLEVTRDISTYGRFTQGAAYALLAKVKLNREVFAAEQSGDRADGDWEGVISACDSVINAGQYSLSPNYHDNFSPISAVNGPANTENIFSVPYDETFGRNFNLPGQTGHYAQGSQFATEGGTPWNGFATLEEFYNSYEDEDLRKGQYGNINIPSNFFVGPMFVPGTDQLIEDGGANDPDGPGVILTPEINEHFPSAYRQAGARVAKYGFYQGMNVGSMDNDFPILRYADVLLMKAEALYRLNGGDDADALALVNQVRARAYGNQDNGLESLNDENLLAERGREMFMEMWRRNDQIRFGTFTSGSWQFKEPSESFRELFPIPLTQIQANPNLVQNRGYLRE